MLAPGRLGSLAAQKPYLRGQGSGQQTSMHETLLLQAAARPRSKPNYPTAAGCWPLVSIAFGPGVAPFGKVCSELLCGEHWWHPRWPAYFRAPLCSQAANQPGSQPVGKPTVRRLLRLCTPGGLSPSLQQLPGCCRRPSQAPGQPFPFGAPTADGGPSGRSSACRCTRRSR